MFWPTLLDKNFYCSFVIYFSGYKSISEKYLGELQVSTRRWAYYNMKIDLSVLILMQITHNLKIFQRFRYL